MKTTLNCMKYDRIDNILDKLATLIVYFLAGEE